jgi:membrane peptidoglycan carboxypeptidase
MKKPQFRPSSLRLRALRGWSPLLALSGTATSTAPGASVRPRLAFPALGQSLRLPHPGVVIVLGVAVTGGIVWWEMHTSTLQSRWFANYARKLTWEVREGACNQPPLAPNGPYDQRLGYRQLAELSGTLTARDYRIASQACPSPELAKLLRRGIAPPYDEKHGAALVISDRNGDDLYRAPLDRFAFGEYGEIPALVVGSLLYVENRHLLDSERPSLNPALEWDRLFFAGAHYALDKVHDGVRVQGGSTLATQIEKFRHSPEGRTSGGTDKVRQIFGASLRAYRDGTDTRQVRREIVLDYLNSMPLGAYPGEGEVTGLGHGMYAWFDRTIADFTADLTLPEDERNMTRKARTYKQALALVMATRRPTLYLAQDRAALEERIHAYLPLLVEAGITSPELAAATAEAPLEFRTTPLKRTKVAFVDRKATNAVRAELLDLLSVPNLYALDRYDLRVETSIDAKVQERVTATLRRLADPNFLAPRGFYGEHLLGPGQDPSKIIYSFSLYQRTPQGNRLRVSADNLEQPLDINRNVKLELGSTAKLRTMANYLVVVADLYEELEDATPEELQRIVAAAPDPITRWTAMRRLEAPRESLQGLLDASLSRTLSADAGESFYTGSGLHHFSNFSDSTGGPTSLRSAFRSSVNLVYIRLMRELVQYYTAQAGYDQRAILSDLHHPQRAELLEAGLAHETGELLQGYYTRYSSLSHLEALAKMCGKDTRGLKRLSIFYLAEQPNASVTALRSFAHLVYPQTTALQDSLLNSYHRAYAGRVKNSRDEAYLLGRHPLEVWLLRDLRDHPMTELSDVMARSRDARDEATEWIRPERYKDAQNLRIRSELERRAFVHIHAAWQKLGYPFGSLVPSLATAIGSSADRPRALAELVGIIQCDGLRVPFLRVEALHFGDGTPYETHFAPASGPGERVMPTEVARSLKGLMRGVVEGGTARRVRGSLVDANGKSIPIGGKTGSGDNRVERFASNGAVISSRAVSRTASFVFTIGDDFFGMVSAYVEGEAAGNFYFTSTLALQAFRALSDDIEPMVGGKPQGGTRSAALLDRPLLTAVPGSPVALVAGP